MQTDMQTSTGRLWSGRIISWLPAIFLLIDGVWKLFKPALVVEATVKLGYSENVIVPLGIVLTLCTILYLIRPTAVLGARRSQRRRNSRPNGVRGVAQIE